MSVAIASAVAPPRLAFADAMDSEVQSAIVAGHGGDDESFEMAEPYRARYREIAHLHTRAPDPPMSWDGEFAPCPSPA